VRQDEALIDEDFILDLHIFSNNADSFNSDPLANDTLPANDAIPDESMTLNLSLA